MRNKLMSIAATSLAAALFFVASFATVKPMCWIALHEPDIPEALR